MADVEQEKEKIMDALTLRRCKPRYNTASDSISFMYFGHIITYRLKDGSFGGKGIKAGHGLDNLLKQL